MSKQLDHKLEQYYARSADSYDTSQLHENDEHYNALMFLRGIIAEKQYESLLDVGCGTGRALFYLRDAHPQLRAIGLEPVEELRQKALAKGFEADQILLGDGRQLPFADKSFDCVATFGVLHHVEQPEQIISEMIRVARRAVFISDHNIYGWGGSLTRLGKQAVRRVFGFSTLKLLMTKGRGYHDTDYDGIFYPFSLFEHLDQVASRSNQMFLMSTKGSPRNLYSQASHLAVFADLDE